MPRAKKSAKVKELSLEDALWNCRVALRGVGSMEKNRDAVISLVFLKFAGDKFEKRRAELIEQYGDIPAFLEKPSFYNADNVFYLEEESRWTFLVKHAADNDIAVKIDTAMARAEDRNPSLKGALPLNLFATLGAERSSLKKLIDSINDIDEKKYQEEDLIGRVYEYFLQIFAVGSSKEDGEFYTPACVVKLIAELIEPYSGVVYDPCCGSGGMFVQSHKFVESHHGNRKAISVVGQESNPDTWRLCKMNLAIRGIAHDLGDEAASTFTHDKHKSRNHQVNYIMANPPFNLEGWRGKKELLKDARWAGFETPPPVANANYAWILHMLSKLDTSKGVAGFLLANGALDAVGIEHDIRAKLLEDDRVEAIFILPRDMFYTTDISVTLWILNMNKKGGERNGRMLRNRTHEFLFVDLRTWDQSIETYIYDKNKRKKKTVLGDEQIARIKALYNAWQDVDSDYKDIPELCASVEIGTIRENDYTLAPSEYIKFIAQSASKPEGIDVSACRRLATDITEAAVSGAEQYLNAVNALPSNHIKNQERTLIRIGDYVELFASACGVPDLTPDQVSGVNRDKEFFEPSTQVGADTSKYKIVPPGYFACNLMHVGRDKVLPIAYNHSGGNKIVSPAYTVFRIINNDRLLEEYFFLLLKSPERDRFFWFHTDTSIRDGMAWDIFSNLEIEVPPKDIQVNYVYAYHAVLASNEAHERLVAQFNSICTNLSI